MKKPCRLCQVPTDSEDLKRCQSPRCRARGDCYCNDCIEQCGEGFHAPFYCNSCNPDKQPPKRKKRTNKKAGSKKTGKRKLNLSGRHARLIRLRAFLGLEQAQMANVVGISHRSYQDWELSDAKMSTAGKVSCWHIATSVAPEFAGDWPEGEHAQKLIERMVENESEQ